MRIFRAFGPRHIFVNQIDQVVVCPNLINRCLQRYETKLTADEPASHGHRQNASGSSWRYRGGCDHHIPQPAHSVAYAENTPRGRSLLGVRAALRARSPAPFHDGRSMRPRRISMGRLFQHQSRYCLPTGPCGSNRAWSIGLRIQARRQVAGWDNGFESE